MNRKLGTTLLIFSALFFLLSVTVAFASSCADGSLMRNVCDDGYAGRVSSATADLAAYYPSVIPSGQSDDRRYPAALAAFAAGDDTAGNQYLAQQLGAGQTLTGRDAVYLAWIKSAYSDKLADVSAVDSAIAQFTPSSSESDTFLRQVATYLADGGDSGPVSQLLSTKGGQGWSSEASPEALADVVVGLSALLAQANDTQVQTLAEMNLDIIFARFAALDAGGAFGGVRVGDAYASPFLNPTASPWYGWSALLFGTTTDGTYAMEPGLVLSGYCANDAVRAVYAAQSNGEQVKEMFNGVSGNAFASIDAGGVFGGSVDLTANGVLSSSSGYVTRAGIRFGDDPLSYILLSTATSDAYDGAPDNGDVVTADGLALGKLGGSACDEPHVVIGRGVAYNTTGSVTVMSHGNQYYAFRFLGKQYIIPLQDRYAPLSGSIPVLDADGGKGWVIIPANPTYGGTFALERIPQSFVDQVTAQGSTGDLLLDLARAVMANTTFTFTTSGKLNYTTDLSGTPITYLYQPGQTLLKDNNPVMFSGFSPRNVLGSAGALISGSNSVWTVTGQLPADGGLASDEKLVLNFASGTKSASNVSYACAGNTTANGTAFTIPDGSRLAFLAASLTQGQDGYSLDCGAAADILPNSAPLNDIANGTEIDGCVMEKGSARTVGLLYDDTGSGAPIQSLIASVKSYYPFIAQGSPLSAKETMCDETLNNNPSSLTFLPCGTINAGAAGKLSVYANPSARIVVFSQDNPFATSALDGLWDWFLGLFGVTPQNGADPSTLVAFTQGYFYRNGSASVDGRIDADGAMTIRYANLSESVEPLVGFFGGGATYAAGGTLQIISSDASQTSAWRAATAALRITSGTPLTFPAECGNGIKETGEQCDGADFGNQTCLDFGGNKGTPACNSDCTVNASSCTLNCTDADHDGYNASAPGCGPADCNDNDASVTTDCTVTNGTTPTPPQCAQSLPGCSAVCNITMPPLSPPLGPCPTNWAFAQQIGDYAFYTRINNQGLPETMINASGRVVNSAAGHFCNWGGTNPHPVQKIVTWSGGKKPKKFIFRYEVYDSNHALINYAYVRLIENGTGWDVRFADGGVKYARECWGVTTQETGGFGGKAIIGMIRPEDQGTCTGYLCLGTSPPAACSQPDQSGSGAGNTTVNDPNSSCLTTPQTCNGVCVDGQCEPPQPCSSDSDCTFGTCVSGFCQSGTPPPTSGACTGDAQCTPPQTCNVTSGQCETPGGGGGGVSCQQASDCASGETCSNGQCVPAPSGACTGDAQCTPPQTCNVTSGQCETPTQSNPNARLEDATCPSQCTAGQQQCSGPSTYQVCGDYNGDGCTEWGASVSCGTGFCSGAGVCSPASQGCTDSDYGVSDYVKGTVTGSGYSYTDTCVDNSTLKEYFCTVNSKPSGMYGETYGSLTTSCGGFKCVDGACYDPSYGYVDVTSTPFAEVFLYRPGATEQQIEMGYRGFSPQSDIRMPAGTYNIIFQNRGGYANATVTGVVVTGGNSTVVPPVTLQKVCFDTEYPGEGGGYSVTVPGVVTANGQSHPDSCSGNVLTDYYCEGPTPTQVMITCGGPDELVYPDCYNGACANLSMLTATLMVNSTPSGAQVFTDKLNYKGTTPLTVKIAPGGTYAYLVTVVKSGYQNYTKSVTVPSAGDVGTIDATLVPLGSS